MKRTQEEIVNRIEARKKYGFLGFETDEYMPHLDYEHAKPYIEDGVTAEQWAAVTAKTLSPAVRIKDYMPFAWDKANNCRGISANRSIEHMIAWLWLDGKDWLEKDYDENYCYYGKPQLVRICEEYGIDWRGFDNGRWRNDEDGESITADEALRRLRWKRL